MDHMRGPGWPALCHGAYVDIVCYECMCVCVCVCDTLIALK